MSEQHPAGQQPENHAENPTAVTQRHRLEQLLHSGLSAEEVAELLDAKRYLRTEKSRSRYAGDLMVFDAQSWLHDNVTQADPILLPSRIEHADTVILPPDLGEIASGSGEGMSEPREIPRTRYVMELLSELGVEYSIIEGTNSPDMFRTLSYRAFLVPELNKILLACNEEANATFVVFERSQTPEQTQATLQATKSLLKAQPNVVVVTYSSSVNDWKARIRDVLHMQEPPAKAAASKPRPSQLPTAKLKTNQELVTAPTGWITLPAIEAYVHRSRNWVEERTKPWVQADPALQRQYRHPRRGHMLDYYAPEVVEPLLQEAGTQEPAPDGWVNGADIAKELGRDPQWVNPRLAELAKADPSLTRRYRHQKGYELQYYPRSIIEKLRELAGTNESAPDGWLTALAIEKSIDRSQAWTRPVLDRLAAEHPEWSGTYRDARGKTWRYYSPELIKKVVEESANRQKAPTGWETVSTLAARIGKSHKWTANRLAALSVASPELTGEFENLTGRLSPHFAPELLEKVEQEALGTEAAPQGWKALGPLADTIGRDDSWVINRIKRLLPKHPDAMRMYLDAGGHSIPHYSPALIDVLQEESNQAEEVPDGWLTVKGLTYLTGRSQVWVRSRLDEIVATNPTYSSLIKNYQGSSGRVDVYYGPELIELVRQQLGQERAPDGWKTVGAVAREIKKSPQWTKRELDKIAGDNPEKTADFVALNGILLAHYSPETINTVRTLSKE